MKLTAYLDKLATDKAMVLDDRIVYLYDTKNNVYFTKVLTVDEVDADGATYMFVGDEPFSSFENLNVIRAWTVTNAVNCMMGLEALTGNYGESEVD